MNRSFRAQESQMQAVMRQRQQVGSLRSSMRKEKEEDLALFLEMRKREKEWNLLQNPEELGAPAGSKPGNSPIFNISSSASPKKTAAEDFLNSDNDKNDYEWLLTPPGTPLFPSLEKEGQKTIMSQIGTPKARPTLLKSRLATPQQEHSPRSLISKQPSCSPGSNTSSAATRKPSSSASSGSRAATPTKRPMLNNSSRPSRSITPTSRSTLPSTKPTTSARSSTPVSRSIARSSTPPPRATILASKPAPRSATPPTFRSSTSLSMPKVSAPAKSVSTVTKSVATTASKNPVPSRGPSPTVKSRPWKPSEMPGFSLDAPPNLRTSLPARPLSASRGRPGAPSARSSSVEPVPSGRVRRQSCSPSRGRTPNGVIHASGSSVPAVSRGHYKANDNVSPVVIGTKMVERVINMRKLAPPKQDNKQSLHGKLSGKSSSLDSSGFGRTLSKKSLDMAIRHMDIRRSIPGNLRPLMTNIPASSMYSVRSGHTQSRTISISGSPLATSSNASSEPSVNNNATALDGSEMDDDIVSDPSGRSPANLQGR